MLDPVSGSSKVKIFAAIHLPTAHRWSEGHRFLGGQPAHETGCQVEVNRSTAACRPPSQGAGQGGGCVAASAGSQFVRTG